MCVVWWREVNERTCEAKFSGKIFPKDRIVISVHLIWRFSCVFLLLFCFIWRIWLVNHKESCICAYKLDLFVERNRWNKSELIATYTFIVKIQHYDCAKKVKEHKIERRKYDKREKILDDRWKTKNKHVPIHYNNKNGRGKENTLVHSHISRIYRVNHSILKFWNMNNKKQRIRKEGTDTNSTLWHFSINRIFNAVSLFSV